MEEIAHAELKAFFAQPKRIAEHLQEANQTLTEREGLLATHQKEIQKVRDEMTRTFRLFQEGQITSQGFGEFYKPAEERLNQLSAELPKIQSDVDFMKVNQLSADDVLHEATALYDRWPRLSAEDKRRIAESLIEKIVIGKDEIDITFSYLPSSEEVCKSQQRLGPGRGGFYLASPKIFNPKGAKIQEQCQDAPHASRTAKTACLYAVLRHNGHSLFGADSGITTCERLVLGRRRCVLLVFSSNTMTATVECA